MFRVFLLVTNVKKLVTLDPQHYSRVKYCVPYTFFLVKCGFSATIATYELMVIRLMRSINDN